jgi:RNA polymerase sigma factor (sigma-70 family)
MTGEARSDAINTIEECLSRLKAGDQTAWNDLMSLAFDRLIDQCGRIIQQELSRPNPLITANSVLAEVYGRLRKAMESENVRPQTAREFYGLAARNIRWQIQDMIRKPSHGQSEEGVLENLAGSRGMTTELLDREKWRRFWTAVDTLTPADREVFDLIWIHGMSQYEAADALGISRNQVDTVWRRIKLVIVKSCKDLMMPL